MADPLGVVVSWLPCSVDRVRFARGPQGSRCTAGGTQRPSSTSPLGEYTRMVRLKSPAGAGSQFDSFSAPATRAESRDPAIHPCST